MRERLTDIQNQIERGMVEADRERNNGKQRIGRKKQNKEI